jgi:hypothetical protein
MDMALRCRCALASRLCTPLAELSVTDAARRNALPAKQVGAIEQGRCARSSDVNCFPQQQACREHIGMDVRTLLAQEVITISSKPQRVVAKPNRGNFPRSGSINAHDHVGRRKQTCVGAPVGFSDPIATSIGRPSASAPLPWFAGFSRSLNVFPGSVMFPLPCLRLVPFRSGPARGMRRCLFGDQ